MIEMAAAMRPFSFRRSVGGKVRMSPHPEALALALSAWPRLALRDAACGGSSGWGAARLSSTALYLTAANLPWPPPTFLNRCWPSSIVA